MPLALLALAVTAFGVGTSEFAIMGLLPQVAQGVGVSIPDAGGLITAYAAGVIVGAPLLTAASARLPRRTTLMIVAALLVAGSALSAVASGYGLLLAARVVAGVPQGALFGVGSVVAAQLVPPERRASAMSVMFGGFTMANVAGVPLVTWLGQAAGWRATFWAIAALGALSMAGIAALVPRRLRPEDETGLRSELATLRRPQVWLAMAVTTAGFGGVFASFTYVTPMMTTVAGFSESSMTPLMVVFGLGMATGNLVSGRFAGRRLMPSLYVFLAGLTIVLTLFVMTAHSKVLAVCTLFLLGLFGFATVPALQMRILDKATGAPTLASALNLSAFNIANALGAFLGGMVIRAGYGYSGPNAVGAVLAATGLALAVCSGLLDARAKAAIAR
ncbi:MFS transporter [Amycolatopsis viridis]|uniref:DHA1 family inner membrane transport protein n=1 Tax=Amycolatopsis viridis TaxID=185678 RepID=A0ABX0SKX5_9PSEU|nr:MFS transporter [Amycolatopsis viridis]NIH77636.1 DHA1 family inner membrane transport protein [Amycolatopsis viridis]